MDDSLKERFDRIDEKLARLLSSSRRILHLASLVQTKEAADKQFNLLMSALDGLAKKIDEYRESSKSFRDSFNSESKW